MQQTKIKEKSKLCLNYEGKFFLFGAIFGALFLIFWNFVLNKENFFESVREEMVIEQVKAETNQMLLNYIDGRWISSANDLSIVIDIDSKKDFVVLETTKGIKNNFKIKNISKINGVLGIVILELCNVEEKCNSKENFIQIQLNKVFGVDKAITITYDSRLAYCFEVENQCVRGFKRHEE